MTGKPRKPSQEQSTEAQNPKQQVQDDGSGEDAESFANIDPAGAQNFANIDPDN